MARFLIVFAKAWGLTLLAGLIALLVTAPLIIGWYVAERVVDDLWPLGFGASLMVPWALASVETWFPRAVETLEAMADLACGRRS